MRSVLEPLAIRKGTLMKALTVGGAMVDTIAIVDDELIERISLSNAGKTFLLLEQGSKTEAADISTHCGGGAINAAVALARLGFEVSVLAKVGDDERARLVRETLTREKISPLGLRTTAMSPTGASAIISAHDRNAAVFTFRGANTDLRAEDIEPKSFRADLVYIASLSGGSADALPLLVQAAASQGAFVSVNPGIKQITTRFEAIRKLLSSLSMIALNRQEAEAFVRQAVAELSGSENARLRHIAAASLHVPAEGAGRRSDAACALVEGLLQLGAPRVLLTDGRHGSYFGTHGEIVFCPALDVTVSSTVGAGDAFVSTFCAMTVDGSDAATALRAAAVNSASVVSRPDTQSGLLQRDAVMHRAQAALYRLPVESWQLSEVYAVKEP
jgi:ribokinase